MAKVDSPGVERRLIVKGRLHEVRCALRSDWSCPAGEFLDLLKNGMWEPDPDAEKLPDDEQIRDRDWFLAAIKYWANEGEPIYSRAVNDLNDGVWEFKRGGKRLSFFDTDGIGGFEMKLRIENHAEAEFPDSEHWRIPGFDEQIRLGHAFPKLGGLTSAEDLGDSDVVREEDLAHDRS
ncbi:MULTISPECIES: hypothetical protein [Rhodococcus]|uniref:hypothetical protein n=1 Tax=Rhodococcus TaxID=1827 RepID=UPI0018A27D6B|nr:MULTISPECIES: hypothetical protein [Rhodococcus]MBF7732542.1 hypothetical protein [Rhodococcus erythropolis]MCJ0900820.1 hypothetical protein [Rhodococcus sp. ARC_M13]MCZ4641200.1 hypothetical protein [Rhodococcus erythropolis]